jgi:hypothetical protein
MLFERCLWKGYSRKKKYFSWMKKGTSLGQSALFEASCVQIGSVVWSVGRVTKRKDKVGMVKYICLYFTYMGAALSQPILTFFGKFSGHRRYNRAVQNFGTIGQGVFVRRIPENRMFP